MNNKKNKKQTLTRPKTCSYQNVFILFLELKKQLMISCVEICESNALKIYIYQMEK